MQLTHALTLEKAHLLTMAVAPEAVDPPPEPRPSRPPAIDQDTDIHDQFEALYRDLGGGD